MNPFNRYNPDPTGKLFYGGGDAGAAVQAALYVASNIYSWKQAKDMPQLQADANKQVLKLQKADYDAISKEQRDIISQAIRVFYSDTGDLLDGDLFEEAYDGVPDAAEFIPVDACCVQGATIECNMSHTDRAAEYVAYVNRMHEQNDMAHALTFCPDFLINLDILNKSIQNSMRGLLSTGDVVEILTDNAEQACLYGRIGTTRRTTARDFGISKMRVQAAGRREFRENTQFINTVVSPMQRQGDIRSMMQTPQDRVNLALSQAQLIQNSLQNKNNQLATANPYLNAELQLRMQRIITKLQSESSKALLVSTHVPNYALTVAPNMQNTAQLLGGIGTAISNVNSSHFFGPPPSSQDGYGKAQNSTYSPPIVSSHNISDRPDEGGFYGNK